MDHDERSMATCNLNTRPVASEEVLRLPTLQVLNPNAAFVQRVQRHRRAA